ncbi:MAG TPA: glycosyltransferase family 4 protein [Polyangia bacterium]|jgi:glycosyltransferase involved in cell wall biosynthesis
MRAPRLLFLVTEEWYFRSHRLGLARAARDAGFEVWAATRGAKYRAAIEAEGIHMVPLRYFVRRNDALLREALAVAELTRLYRRVRPDIVHQVGLKPIVHGTLAARLAGVPAVVNAVTGLGYAFAATGLERRALARLIVLALRVLQPSQRSIMIFQNETDRRELLRLGVVDPGRAVLIQGSGVELPPPRLAPPTGDPPLVVIAARMIRDKGVGELVAAGRLLKERGVPCRIALVGAPDPHNPATFTERELRAWCDEGVVEWWGQREDVPAILAGADVACLPSYREGLSKFLLEAAAASLPIVTSDAPGCRELVREGENGLLVPVGDAAALAAALERLARRPAERAAFGARSRVLVAPFTADRVVADTLAVYQRLLGPHRGVAAAPAPAPRAAAAGAPAATASEARREVS